MNKLQLTAVALSAAIISSCNKDYKASPGPYTLQSAIAEVAVKSKKVVLDADAGGTFVGNSGTSYTFPPSAFKTPSGAVITGKVDVEVSEFLKKSDMMFSDVLPVSNGAPLISGGEVNVKATQNGAELQMAGGKTFRANMPMKGTNATGMQLFTGTLDPQTKMVNWRVADTAGTAGGANPGIAHTADTISIISNEITYCNADRFLESPDYQAFKVTVTVDKGSIADNELKGYTLYDQYNGVWPMYEFNSHIHNEYHVPNIPVHFVVYGTINGDFYGGITGATPKTGASYTVTLTKTTPAAFKTLVDAL